MQRLPETIRDAVAAFATTRPFAAALALTAFVSGVALVFPGLDIAVARLFWFPGVDPHTPFPAENWPALLSLRQAGMAVTRWATILCILAILAKIVAPLLARMLPTRDLLFVVGTLALGPGLLVNGFLKEFWGRPRPIESTVFGGPWTFMPAWIPGGDCPTNCSFPSGEASGAAWLLALVFVAPQRWRKPLLALVLAWMATISANRMVFGSHYLSDVLIGWCLMLVVLTGMRELIFVRLPDRIVDRIDAGLAIIGEAMVKPFRPRP
ncbi:MAG: phosphatase PAP2 family protein [Hyphomicrobiales bacterium]|nr:phosphatase PAP2 family protein [Hyphomicrobiales bacterium]